MGQTINPLSQLLLSEAMGYNLLVLLYYNVDVVLEQCLICTFIFVDKGGRQAQCGHMALGMAERFSPRTNCNLYTYALASTGTTPPPLPHLQSINCPPRGDTCD